MLLFSLALTALSLPPFSALLQQGSISLNVTCDDTHGQVIAEPVPGGPADAAGIRSGDRLLAINNLPLTPATCNQVLDQTRAVLGTPTTFTVQTGTAPARTYSITNSVPRSGMLHVFLNLGLALPGAAAGVIVLEGISLLIFWAFGLVIVWGRSDDGMALLTSALLLVGGVRFGGLFAALPDPTLNRVILSGYAILLCLFFGIFPNGRFTPRGIIGLWLVYCVTSVNGLLNLVPLSSSLSAALDLGLVVSVAASQVYRYRHQTSAAQRQQTKWVVFGIMFSVLGFYAFRLPDILGIALSPSLVDLSIALPRVTTLIAPLTIGLAVLRFRLFEVDLVINRSLVYGTATLLLAGVFALVVLVIHALLGDQGSGLAFAAAAVGVGVLFNPTRKKVRNLVDRHVYGFRFDLYELRAAQRPDDITHPGEHTGKILGEYHVLDVVGKGGMGEVYKATDGEQTVALKILPENLAAQPVFRSRFQREARTLTALNHPNIVRMQKFGQQDGLYYIAMELVEGEELSTILQERGRLSLDEVRALAADCAAALDYAHAQGFVHRDIKASNVMLQPLAYRDDLPEPCPEPNASIATLEATYDLAQTPYKAVLMDFGIAKMCSAETSLTGTNAIGTIDYMAPEQIMAAREVDHRADIYGLGVVLYEALTGEKPFKGSAGQVLFAHLQQPSPDPRRVVDDLPPQVTAALNKALAKNPEDRFQTASEFAAALGCAQAVPAR